MTSKVVAILLTFGQGDEFSITEIARLTGLPVSTAHRLVAELVDAGILVRTDVAHYRTGTQLRAILSEPAGCVLPPPTLHERARRILEDLAVACGPAVIRLGVLDGAGLAFIEKSAAARPVSTVFESASLPVHATAMGKALLAFAPPEVVERVVSRGLRRFTEFTVTSTEALLRVLATVRLTRMAVCRQELAPGDFAAAVPVVGARGAVVAALEGTVRRARDLRLVQPALVVAARTLTRELTTNHAREGITIGGDRQLDVMIFSQDAASAAD